MRYILAFGLALVSATASATANQPDALMETKVKALAQEADAAQAKGDHVTMFAKFDAIVTLTENPDAMHKLAHLYESAEKVPGSGDKAQHWFVQSAKLGFGESLRDIVRLLKNDASLPDKNYSTLVRTLAQGIETSFDFAASDVLSNLAAKQAPALKCAVDAAKRLGYAADDQAAFFGRGIPSSWYRVRSGTSSRGDRLDIHGATDDADFPESRYARLNVSGTGFTGIKFTRQSLSEGRFLELKDYTGYVETTSPEARRDIEMITKTCRP